MVILLAPIREKRGAKRRGASTFVFLWKAGPGKTGCKVLLGCGCLSFCVFLDCPGKLIITLVARTSKINSKRINLSSRIVRGRRGVPGDGELELLRKLGQENAR